MRPSVFKKKNITEPDTSISLKNVKIVPVKMRPSVFKKKNITEPDTLHPVYNFFQIVNRMAGHPIHISK